MRIDGKEDNAPLMSILKSFVNSATFVGFVVLPVAMRHSLPCQPRQTLDALLRAMVRISENSESSVFACGLRRDKLRLTIPD